MQFYTTEKLGLTRERTPEGFLLCKSAPIARTGTMLYAAGEVPVASLDGIVRIERSPEDVFAVATIASFQGKPLCLDHPTVDVDPSNWAALAKGVVQNVRRGTGLDHDLLIADILVTDAAAIKAIENGTVELSAGYDADYSELEPGRGRQRNILGNHVALVEKGRCGSRCAIGDSAMKKNKFIDRLRAAFQNRDEAELEKALAESETQDTAEESEEEKKKREAEESKKTGDSLARIADSLEALSSRVAALETRDAKAKDEDEDEEKKDEDGKTSDADEDEDESDDDEKTKKSEDKKARDSAAALTESQDVFARAEILAPGLSLPTFDAATTPEKVRDSLCALRRKALETAFAGKYRDAIMPFVGRTPDFAKLTCDALTSTFIGASEIVRRENNAQATVTFDAGTTAKTVAGSIHAINRKNAAFWSRS